MFSLSLSLPITPSALRPVSIRRGAPCSKDRILTSGPGAKSRFGKRFRASAESGRMAGAFGRSEGFDGISLGEAEAILGNGALSSSSSSSSSSVVSSPNSAWGSVESTINQMSKWIVAALFGLVILWKHDAEALWAAMGSVVNSWLSITLKRILNHERPSALRSDPGMPSSHAQSIFYAAIFAIFSLVYWLGTNILTITLGIAIVACGSYLSWLRVSQQLHTISQVLVGAVLGSTCGIVWFWMWHSFVFEAFIASIWVRILVVLGSAAFCAAFLIYVIRHWLQDEH
ncbi:lipid phosphate phosphatase epsilon 2, chloroplastic [Ananas comosus]|uniref:Lipid phosphate phosphatase epsilon 2, chloroplastic n=1 Tax=Ananas comosus TaxID=4615 RepID=A0A199VSZ2_ANACO|nr:lipid phosphate phosphatase epsilon 2, chloroplastic [Ananas comosus]OAY80337.1 Lipid phosphate phosphatase epsilon 2, chloroplastic [Ananas comosus]